MYNMCVSQLILIVSRTCAYALCREKEEWLDWMDDPGRMGNLVFLELPDYGSDHFMISLASAKYSEFESFNQFE